ncbi:MAG: 30S ribosome-binding factor RbfA [Oligoflexia bacterium]|nr:30S ribosome-binding factor RbfA [Oligoflexia bacterium]
MLETRRQRLQAVIQEELATVIAREVKDPRIPSVTITSVQVTPDGGQATVFIAILGASMGIDEKAQTQSQNQRMKDCLQGLNSAAGFLRRHIAGILTVRHIPTLIFREDRGFENTIRVHELLKEISTKPAAPASDDHASHDDNDDDSTDK